MEPGKEALVCRTPDCENTMPSRPGGGAQREFCDECKAMRHKDSARDSYRRKHQDWEEGKRKQAEQQREFRARGKARRQGNRANLTDPTNADLVRANEALERRGLMRDESGGIVPKAPNTPMTQAQINKDDMLQQGHEGETTLAGEQDKAERLRQATRTTPSLPVRGRGNVPSIEEQASMSIDQQDEVDRSVLETRRGPQSWHAHNPGSVYDEPPRRVVGRQPQVRSGTAPMWEAQLRPDPLAAKNEYGYGGWASDPSEYALSRLGVTVPIPKNEWSHGLFAVAAASGGAVSAIAHAMGRRVVYAEDAVILTRYLAGTLDSWTRKKIESVIRRVESGEIRDAMGRLIRPRSQRSGGRSYVDPSVVDPMKVELADAIVDLAVIERDGGRA